MSLVFQDRLDQLQHRLSDTQAILLSEPRDITYFSGFQTLVPEERESFLLVTSKKTWLLYASFSPLPAGITLETLTGTDPTRLTRHCQVIQAQTGFTELFVDKTKLYVDEFEALQHLKTCTFLTLDKTWTWKIRALKDDSEIRAITQASHIANQAFERLQTQLQVGLTEIEVQDLLEQNMRQLGSRMSAFPTIVAFGNHGALPHYQPGITPLQPETAILIDFGATHDLYRSDMTRSWWYGQRAHPTFSEIEKVVKTAYQAALQKAIETPIGTLTAADLDRAARSVIDQAGFREHFIHTTGHGVGLDIHEPPSIIYRNSTVLKPGMVITIEPGIYLEGLFGYRHENTVLVTEVGLKELTSSDTIT